jgi:hypothetical protein
MGDQTGCGFAAAHSGKPPAYRHAPTPQTQEAPPPLLESGRHSLGKRERAWAGKPEAYRYVLRQSREAN